MRSARTAASVSASSLLGSLVLAGTTLAGSATYKPTPNPSSAVPAGALQGLCYANPNGRLLIARPFAWGDRPPSEHLDDEFRDFVMKTYGAPAGVSVYCGSGTPDGVARARQQKLDAIRLTPSNQIVEFDWAPQAPAQSEPPRAAAPPAATKPAAPARPATARAATGATAAPSVPAPRGPTTYSYCYAYGTPAGRSGAAVKQDFYVSQPFVAAGSGGLNQAFESFLRGAHPGETLSASCLSPLPLDAAQGNRQQTLALKRRQTTQWHVVEVDWKR